MGKDVGPFFDKQQNKRFINRENEQTSERRGVISSASLCARCSCLSCRVASLSVRRTHASQRCMRGAKFEPAGRRESVDAFRSVHLCQTYCRCVGAFKCPRSECMCRSLPMPTGRHPPTQATKYAPTDACMHQCVAGGTNEQTDRTRAYVRFVASIDANCRSSTISY